MKRIMAVLLSCVLSLSMMSTVFARDREIDGQEIYNRLCEEMKKVAEGERKDSKDIVLIERKEKLIVEDITLKEVEEDIEAVYEFVLPYVESTTILLPYESYWWDFTQPISIDYDAKQVGRDLEIDYLSVSLPVIKEYSKTKKEGCFELDPDIVKSAQNAKKNAQKIVDDASDLTDYGKLVYYKDEIRGLVTHKPSSATAWQLINVFDGDPDTNAAEDGYAKAFKYLCDLTDFDSPLINCRVISGYLEKGWYCWDVVTMDDGENYLVDLKEEDEYEADCNTFLVGAVKGNVEDGYIVRHNYDPGTNSYQYAFKSFFSYFDEQLELADHNYTSDEVEELREEEEDDIDIDWDDEETEELTIDKVYERFQEKVTEIANGEVTHTEDIILIDEGESLTIDKSDVDYCDFDYNYSGKLHELLYERIMLEMPVESYWIDYVQGAMYSYYEEEDGDEVTIYYLASHIPVILEYSQKKRNGTYDIDPKASETVQNSLKNAQKIVEEAASLDDFEKIEYYRKAIQDAVVYDVESMDTHQLVNAFDNDPSTNICCEGYAKAFQYLCEQTKFDSDKITSRVVHGWRGGGHAWNVVTMEDGKNYLFDITEGDGDDWYEFNDFVLVGARKGDVESGYSVNVVYNPDYTEDYTYLDYVIFLYPKKKLELANKNYH